MTAGTSGTSGGPGLAALLGQAPLSTVAVLGLVEALAGTAAAAHGQGLALGLCEPCRVRAGADGLVARPVPAGSGPGSGCGEDVRGLSAIMYTLLVGGWPLAAAAAARAGLPAAVRDGRGVVVAPALARPGVSEEVSALVMAALGVGDPLTRVRTAAAVQRLCGQLLASAREVVVLPAPRDGAPSDPEALWRTASFPAITGAERGTPKLNIGIAALCLSALAGLGYIGVHLAVLLGVTPPSPPRYVLTGTAASATSPTAPRPSASVAKMRFAAGRAWPPHQWAGVNTPPSRSEPHPRPHQRTPAATGAGQDNSG